MEGHIKHLVLMDCTCIRVDIINHRYKATRSFKVAFTLKEEASCSLLANSCIVTIIVDNSIIMVFELYSLAFAHIV